METLEIKTSISYPVMEHFYTLQGEGLHTGKAAYFVRLGGCDVGCVWCDVKDSWDASKHPLMTTEEIVRWPYSRDHRWRALYARPGCALRCPA